MDPVRESGNASLGRDAAPRWTFVTNHFLVLASVAANPDIRVRDIAAAVGITERATQAILSDLAGEGYVERIRIGRRNRYKVRRGAGSATRSSVERRSERCSTSCSPTTRRARSADTSPTSLAVVHVLGA